MRDRVLDGNRSTLHSMENNHIANKAKVSVCMYMKMRIASIFREIIYVTMSDATLDYSKV